MAYKAIIVGATGLIGSNLLNILLKEPEYDQILIFVRRPIELKHEKLTQVIINFDQINDYRELINGHAIFCCLGSTKKKTPDLNMYRKVDHDYPVHLAQLGKENGVSQYHLVSALGANPTSSNFYLKMKGETEADIKKTGIKSLHIYQPSFLTGNRNENRPLERIAGYLMRLVDPLLIGGLKKYRSIAAKTVAQAMYNQSLKTEDGIFIYPSDKIKQL